MEYYAFVPLGFRGGTPGHMWENWGLWEENMGA